MQQSVNGISNYLKLTIRTKLYTERRQPDSTVADETFRIPELLEMTLEHTHAIDILNVSATCKALKAIIEASPKLQKALFLRSAGVRNGEDTRFNLHPLSKKGLCRWFRLESENYLPEGLDIIATFPRGFGKNGLPWAGTALKKMQICQPPICLMGVFIECKNCETHSRDWNDDTVHNDEGLTFGELWHVANEIYRRNERCECGAKQSAWSNAVFVANDPFEVDEDNEDDETSDSEDDEPSDDDESSESSEGDE